MKQKLLYICLVIAAFAWSGKAAGQEEWGKYTSYVFEDDHSYDLYTIETGPTFQLAGPGKTVTFEGYRQNGIFAANYFFLEASLDGKDWDKYSKEIDLPFNNYVLKSDTPDIEFYYIRFRTKTGATWRKYYRNIKVTRATTLSTAPTSLDFGNVRKGETKELTVSVDYNNTTYPWQITGTCDNPDFQVETVTADEYGTVSVTVKYTPTSAGTANGTVTLHMNGVETSFSVSGIGETIYYGKADVQSTEGGEAYVSIQGDETATDKSYSFDSGVTTEASASINVHYSAQPNEGYAFVGWQNIETEKILSKDEQYTHNFTYTSEDANEPTLLSLKALFQEKTLVLEPTSPAYEEGFYKHVVLNRTLKQGYNSIALPFDTSVKELTSSDGMAWVAQLQTVTWNSADGYSLYFQKVEGGKIEANQPYVLYLNEAVETPKWENINREIAQPIETSIEPQIGYSDYRSWTMNSNFAAVFDMNGNYGIVNEAKGLKLGGERSILNAFTAYITSPVAERGNSFRVRAVYIDPDGTTTFVDGLPVDGDWEWTGDGEPAAIYGPDGTQRAQLIPGVNIVRYGDGRTRKVYKN